MTWCEICFKSFTKYGRMGGGATAGFGEDNAFQWRWGMRGGGTCEVCERAREDLSAPIYRARWIEKGLDHTWFNGDGFDLGLQYAWIQIETGDSDDGVVMTSWFWWFSKCERRRHGVGKARMVRARCRAKQRQSRERREAEAKQREREKGSRCKAEREKGREDGPMGHTRRLGCGPGERRWAKGENWLGLAQWRWEGSQFDFRVEIWIWIFILEISKISKCFDMINLKINVKESTKFGILHFACNLMTASSTLDWCLSFTWLRKNYLLLLSTFRNWVKSMPQW